MTSRLNSGQKKLQQLIGSRTISPSGADWLVVAADPMHDLELSNLCGYPDTQVGQSVVMKIPSEIIVTSPDGLADGTTWQFMLQTWPWTLGDTASASVTADYKLTGNLLGSPTAQIHVTNRLPAVSVYKGVSGNNLGPFALGDAGNSVNVEGIGLDDSYATGCHRVIAWGVEVYDTTAVIARQGTCTVWRQNTNTYNKSAYFYASPDGSFKNIGVCSGVAMKSPPANIAEANLLAGTRSWKAEDGCYLVAVQNQEQLLAKQPDDTQPIIFQNDVSTGIRTAALNSPVISGGNVQVAQGDINVSIPGVVWNMQPYHMSGAFFTGLPKSGSYLVRNIFYVEKFPTPYEPNIVLLTKPSANHDPVALELYDHMLKDMPVGVPVAENGLGEWFDNAISSVVPILKGIPTPVTQALGMAGDYYINNFVKPQAAKTIPKPRGPNPNAVTRAAPKNPKPRKPPQSATGQPPAAPPNGGAGKRRNRGRGRR